MMPGMPERRTHDYARNGITSLFAAFNIADGTVISALHRPTARSSSRSSWPRIDTEVPAHLDVHLICDNYGTHKTPAVNTWLARHPRFHLHFTPTSSSWLNQVERWFAYITDELIRRSHPSVQALEADIRAWVKPGTRIPSRSSGPRPPRRSSNHSDDFFTNHRRRTLGWRTPIEYEKLHATDVA